MRELAKLAARLAEIERRVYGQIRHGTVHSVDPAAGTMRLKLGAATGGGDFLSPDIPYAQHAGALKAHVPPSVGQQMTILAPSGDWRAAVAVPMTWSDQNQSPSGAPDENVITFGSVHIVLKDDSLTAAIGGVTFKVSAQGVEITGGHVRHDGKDIGATHRHGGVDRGGADTDPPN